ncbi:DUF429 domain-containing protein [Demequina soli]|uniref:DUF429 domain-containing protein n=1 Tax=Demequina soli TaxID=1638987 RepID=UPI00078366C3|nr:DUF429 domain-containing protein [Demequina soli]
MFVGIDLAWGDKARTGLAVVDAEGRLTVSGAVRTDDEISEWLSAHAHGARVVAVDAPLIVPNHTGQRIAENLIGRAYGRYGASAHTSNRGKPQFDPPRAERLAARFGWTIDPAATSTETQCIEVYPHAALVGLFELPARILYKKGPDRAAGFDQLAALLEGIPALGLLDGDRWRQIRATISAPRPGDLDRIEDEIDAIICAHVAWLWQFHREELHVYGSAIDGYIVAPPAPSHPARLAKTTSEERQTRAPALTIRGLEGQAHATLVSLAARNGRSPADQARALIEAELNRIADAETVVDRRPG